MNLTIAYIINLAHRTDRLEHITRQCANNNLELVRIEAIEGRERFANQPKKKRGYLGCYESHLMLLKMLLAKKEDFFLIAEDDCIFEYNFKHKLSVYLKQLPEDFDMLYLGGSLVRENATADYSENIKIAKDVLCTHAYIISKKALPELIQAVETRKHKIDVLYCEYQKTHKCFIVYPELAWQMISRSNVISGTADNNHLRYGTNKQYFAPQKRA